MLNDLLFWLLHDPPVVDVLVAVACHLLLVGGASAIRILHGINSVVGVQPTCAAVGVSQGDLGAVKHLDGLVCNDGCQAALGERNNCLCNQPFKYQ